MKIANIELKAEVESYSASELHPKIFSLYGEAKEEKGGNNFKIGHLVAIFGLATNVDKVRKPGVSSTKYSDGNKYISNSEGDIKKLKDYVDLMKLLDAAKTVAESSGKSEFLKQTVELHDMLVTNKPYFAKGYKFKDNISVAIYENLAAAFIYRVDIIASAMVATIENPKVTMDAYIEKTKGWKELFFRSNEVLRDKDLKVLIQKSTMELKAEAMVEYAENLADLTQYYSEVSLQDVSLIMKLGLAKIAYKLCGLIRFIIYIGLYSGYYIADRLDSIKKILSYYSADAESRLKNEDKVSAMLTEKRIDDIKVFDSADKDVNAMKVSEKEAGEFQL